MPTLLKKRITFFKQSIRILFLSILLSLATALPVLAEHQATAPTASLAIIIDDIGNHFELGKRAIDLPGQLTYAILPATPQGARLASYMSRVAPEKEIILHMPMEAQGGQRLGGLGLYDTLQQTEFSQRLNSALAEIPQATGVSNHMGSHLTRQQEKMEWLMAELQPRNLFFVDSKTTVTDAAASAATQYRVPYIARDVFLDHHRDGLSIQRNFEKAVKYAQEDGLAVLIGHPYRLTLRFLEQELPKLEARGVKLISISDALKETYKNQKVAMISGTQPQPASLSDI